MKLSSPKKLQYFVGKPCTIFLLGSLQRTFNEQQFIDYFVGRVESLDEDGIISSHPVTNCKNFYPWSAIGGISEEQCLDPSKPEEALLIEKMKAAPEVQQTQSPYVDIDIMSQLAKQAKEMVRK